MLLKKVRKLKKFTNFYLLTFELGENIRKQKKTCPGGQVLKLWLESVIDFRTKDILDLLTVGKNINNIINQ
jgi:hypothetical protein